MSFGLRNPKNDLPETIGTRDHQRSQIRAARRQPADLRRYRVTRLAPGALTILFARPNIAPPKKVRSVIVKGRSTFRLKAKERPALRAWEVAYGMDFLDKVLLLP